MKRKNQINRNSALPDTVQRGFSPVHLLLVLLTALVFLAPSTSDAASQIREPDDQEQPERLALTGKVVDSRDKGLKDAEIAVFINGNPAENSGILHSSSDGTFEADLVIPGGVLSSDTVTIEVSKPSYQNSGPIPIQFVANEIDGDPRCEYLTNTHVELFRSITPAFWIAAGILLLVYVIIALELMHRTLAALMGAGIILFVSYTFGTFSPDFFILSFEDAISAVDFNVIFLLMGMMMIIGVLKKTGVFQWLSCKCYELARGNIIVLSIILMIVTAVLSALLDNVTTMLLMIPVTIEIAITLKLNPVALLLPEVFASNVGGAATLVGDPPNIMIGSYANLSFVDFLYNLGPICLILLAVSVLYFVILYRKDYLKAQTSPEQVKKTIEHLRQEYRITDGKLLLYSGIVLGLTILFFILHGVFGMEPSIAAVMFAGVLLVVGRIDIVEMLEHEVEWPTLIFFIMLFIVVAGAEETGLIQIIANWVNHMSGGSIVAAILIILWVSAIASAIVDNIPFTATMLPIVAYLTEVIPGAETGILWWALALGACLGGNGTMIGASANVVTVGMAERAGYHISFMHYMKIAFPPMLITIAISSIWLLMVR